jgi:hypothetical protein
MDVCKRNEQVSDLLRRSFDLCPPEPGDMPAFEKLLLSRIARIAKIARIDK